MNETSSTLARGLFSMELPKGKNEERYRSGLGQLLQYRRGSLDPCTYSYSWFTRGAHRPIKEFTRCSEKSHAVVAERWLEKHLKEKGKSWQRDSGMIILPLSLK